MEENNKYEEFDYFYEDTTPGEETKSKFTQPDDFMNEFDIEEPYEIKITNDISNQLSVNEKPVNKKVSFWLGISSLGLFLFKYIIGGILLIIHACMPDKGSAFDDTFAGISYGASIIAFFSQLGSLITMILLRVYDKKNKLGFAMMIVHIVSFVLTIISIIIGLIIFVLIFGAVLYTCYVCYEFTNTIG